MMYRTTLRSKLYGNIRMLCFVIKKKISVLFKLLYVWILREHCNYFGKQGLKLSAKPSADCGVIMMVLIKTKAQKKTKKNTQQRNDQNETNGSHLEI